MFIIYNRLHECIICFDLLPRCNINMICSKCNCYICNTCLKQYINIHNNTKCPKCRYNLQSKIILKYSNNSSQSICCIFNNLPNYFEYVLKWLIIILFLVISYWLGYIITKSHNDYNIFINFLLGLILSLLVIISLSTICILCYNISC